MDANRSGLVLPSAITYAELETVALEVAHSIGEPQHTSAKRVRKFLSRHEIIVGTEKKVKERVLDIGPSIFLDCEALLVKEKKLHYGLISNTLKQIQKDRIYEKEKVKKEPAKKNEERRETSEGHTLH